MDGFSAKFDKSQHAAARERGENLVCVSVIGKHAKQASIEFAGPVEQRHASMAVALITTIGQERAGGDKTREGDAAKLVAELLPCPLCGKRVDFQHGSDPYDDARHSRGFAIQCDPCNLSLWSFKFEQPAALVARWNRRQHVETPPDALTADELAQLRELESQATPADKWVVEVDTDRGYFGDQYGRWYTASVVTFDAHFVGPDAAEKQAQANAALLKAARAALPRLLAEAGRLRAEAGPPAVPDAVREAARRTVAGYQRVQELLPLAGGVARPLEESTDHAVVMARFILGL